jgi:hypothetical protein
MKYAIEITSGGMRHIPSFMAIHLGIEVMLKLLPQNLLDFNADISDGRDL